VEDIICTPFFSISFNRNFQGLTYFSFSLIGWIKGLFTFKDVVDNNDEFISNRNNGIPLHIGVLTEFVFVVLFKCRRESPAGIGSIVERSSQIWGTSPGYGASPSYRVSRFLDRGVDTCISLSFLTELNLSMFAISPTIDAALTVLIPGIVSRSSISSIPLILKAIINSIGNA